MNTEKVFTLTTRIRMNDEIYQYLTEYITEYNRLYRRMWRMLCSAKGADAQEFKEFYKSENILRRTADTIKWSVIGRKRALYEYKKYELSDIEERISRLKNDAESIKQLINKLKPDVTANKASAAKLALYRRKKHLLYLKSNKLNMMIQKRDNLIKEIESGELKLSFGGKGCFKKQFRLSENKFSDHNEWYKYYIGQRDKVIDYIGGAAYTCGNDICQMYYDEETDRFNIKLRKEKFLSSKSDKYLDIENIRFNYLSEYLKKYIIQHQCAPHDGTDKTLRPLTYRIKRKGAKWYLQVIIKIPPADIVTSSSEGVISIKLTPEAVQTAETDKYGNLISLRKYALEHSGTGSKGDNEMKKIISEITGHAQNKGKDISIENLDFAKKLINETNKKTRAVLAKFAYSRFTSAVESSCYRKGVTLITVNPAYTAVVSKGKYARQRKLSNIQATAYVIARLGQGFTDKFDGKTTKVNKRKTA